MFSILIGRWIRVYIMLTWEEILKYFEKVYFPAIAHRVVPILLYSAAISQFVKYEKELHMRFRLNVMLNWKHGYVKSTLLDHIAELLPLRCRKLTASSSAAIRGSFVDNQIYVPELLLCDIMMFPEFTAIMKSDEDTIAALLVILEDADVSVALVKGGRASASEVKKLEALGAHFEHKRLMYRNQAIVWTATHTLDNIPDKLRDALLERWKIIYIPPSEIPEGFAYQDPTELRDTEYDIQIADTLKVMFSADRKPDLKFQRAVVNKLHPIWKDQEKSPRDIGDVRRVVLAHKYLFPEATIDDTLEMILRLDKPFSTLTTRERIAELITKNPRTLQELLDQTGVSKNALYMSLKRLGALKTGNRPSYYYLDSIPVNFMQQSVRISKGIEVDTKLEEKEVE